MRARPRSRPRHHHRGITRAAAAADGAASTGAPRTRKIVRRERRERAAQGVPCDARRERARARAAARAAPTSEVQPRIGADGPHERRERAAQLLPDARVRIPEALPQPGAGRRGQNINARPQQERAARAGPGGRDSCRTSRPAQTPLPRTPYPSPLRAPCSAAAPQHAAPMVDGSKLNRAARKLEISLKVSAPALMNSRGCRSHGCTRRPPADARPPQITPAYQRATHFRDAEPRNATTILAPLAST